MASLPSGTKAPRQNRPTPDRGKRGARTAPRPDGLPARRAALDVLMLIRRGATLDIAMTTCHSYAALDGSDKAFARLLTSTTLRYRGSLDDIIGHFLRTPLPPRAIEAQDILRLVGAQLLHLKTPAHAAVSTAVALCDDRKELSGYKGLLNAVARKIADQGPGLAEKQPRRINTPGWMWRSWERAFGPALTRRIADAHQTRAPLDLTVRDPESRPPLAREMMAAFAGEGSGYLDADTHRDTPLPPVSVTSIGPTTLRLQGYTGGVDALPGFETGKWWVQDLSASVPACLMGDIAGKTVYDLCAAPGGKTAQLARMGANVTAVDIGERRLDRVRGTLDRLGLDATLIAADVLDWSPPGLADAILLDAPCTATGTIRRHPDILWSCTQQDVDTRLPLQKALIDKALSLLKPGGRLVYAVCSLQREEGEGQMDDAIRRHDGLRIAAPNEGPSEGPSEGSSEGPDEETPGERPDGNVTSLAACPGLGQAVSERATFRALPCYNGDLGGMDGFFAAAVSKPG